MEQFMDALLDTGRLVPLLAGVYVLVAFLEYRFGDGMGVFLTRFGVMAPAAGALLGCIPQCGFSVVAAALYIRRLISPGTLLAVFISTSDEAIPVLLSMPEQGPMVAKLLTLKVVIAIVAGVMLDLLLRRRVADNGNIPSKSRCGCCAHDVSGVRSWARALLWHPFWHTIKIFAFLFILTFMMNLAVAGIGEDRIGAFLLQGTIFQPLLAVLVGLIPNCFASVLLADLFAAGTLTFGSLVSGLCAGAGLGLLLLVRENRPWQDTAMMLGVLTGVSIAAGMVIQSAGALVP